MPRRSGLDSAEMFHVFNRGADRQDIFVTDRDQRWFELLLAEMVAECGVLIHAYALMSNHYHLILQAVGKRLSEAMYLLGKEYALYFNDTTDRSGPLCDGRFNAVPIVDSNMLMVEGRYVHRNPIDIVGVRALPSYRYSSLPAYLGSTPVPDWLTTGALLAPFQGDRAALLDFVQRTHPTDAQYSGARPPLRPATIDDVCDAVAACAGIAPESLRAVRRGARNDPRSLVAVLALELRVASAAFVAEAVGFSSSQTVRNAAARGRARLAVDPAFSQFRKRVLRHLSGQVGYDAPGAA